MIKKIVCAALMLSILAMSSMGAFAAVTSSTAYVAGTNDVTVTTVVDGVEAGDTVTYLAYKEATEGEGPTDSNIAYIDQVTLDAGDIENVDEYTFVYTTTTDKIGTGSVVKQAGLKADGSAITLATDEDGLETPAPVGCVITVNETEAKTYETKPSGDWMEVPFTSGVVASVKVGSDDVDWYAVDGGSAISTNLWSTDGLDLTVETTEAAASVEILGVKGYKDAKAAVVQVTGAATEYGVIFADDTEADVYDATTDAYATAEGAKAGKFFAGGKGSDGKFMIIVEGTNNVGDTFYAKAFAGATETEYKSYTVKNANIAE